MAPKTRSHLGLSTYSQLLITCDRGAATCSAATAGAFALTSSFEHFVSLFSIPSRAAASRIVAARSDSLRYNKPIQSYSPRISPTMDLKVPLGSNFSRTACDSVVSTVCLVYAVYASLWRHLHAWARMVARSQKNSRGLAYCQKS